MKKRLGLFMALAMAAVVIVVTGIILLGSGNKNDSTSNIGNGDTSGNSSQNGIKINLADNSNYFAIVDGKKYTVSNTIQNILNDGYTVSESGTNLKQVLEAGEYSANTVNMRKGNSYDAYFAVTPINRTAKSLTLAECTLYEIHLNDTWYKNVSIVGGITFGNSIEEVEEVFGIPTTKEANVLKPEEMTVAYYQGTNRVSGNFLFHFNSDGKLYSIIMTSNKN